MLAPQAPATLLTLAALALSAGSPAAEPKHGEFASESIKVSGTTREYRLVVPKSVDLAKPAPLVIAFHGVLIDSKDLMPKYTKLNDTARKHGFILVYPNALDRNWGLSIEKAQGDVAFFDSLLKKLSADYKIDRNRKDANGVGQGVVAWDVEVTNQDGELVASYDILTLVAKRA